MIGARGLPPPPIEPEHLARAILAEPRFRRAAVHAAISPWAVAWRWLVHEWAELVTALARSAHLGSAAPLVAEGALGLAVLVLGGFIAHTIAAGLRKRPRAVTSMPLPQTPGAHQLYAAGTRAAAEGAYAAAIVLLFRATLRVLDRRALVPDAPSRTVNETRSALRSVAPQLLEAFDGISQPFVAALYAERPTGPEEWHTAQAAFAAAFPEVVYD